MKIQEVAQKTNVSIYTLRYYEKVGLVVPIKRAVNGHRQYTEDDLNRIIFITRLRAAGMPIVKIQRYMQLVQAGDKTVIERLRILEEHKVFIEARINELHEHLDVISQKIAHYREMNHLPQKTTKLAVPS